MRLLKKYADRVALAEPSQRQLNIGAEFLKTTQEVDRQLGPSGRDMCHLRMTLLTC